VEVRQEAKQGSNLKAVLPDLEIRKIQARVRQSVEERKALVRAFEAGVSQEGIQLYQMLEKTMGAGKVTWDDKNIIVHDISVSSPYKVDNCTPLPGNRGKGDTSLNYVKTQVNRYWDSCKNPTNAVTSPTAAAPPVATPQTSSTARNSPPVPPTAAEVVTKPASPAVPPSAGGGGGGKGHRGGKGGLHSPTGGGPPKGKKGGGKYQDK